MNPLEMMERRAWDAERERADRTARGSRAGTSTIAGQSVEGVVLAETSIKYGTSYTVEEDGGIVQTTLVGFGVATYGGTFAYA